MSRFVNFIFGALLGGLIGTTLAFLLTPASGENLRKQIRETAIDIQEEVRQAANDRRIELEKQLETLRAPQKGTPR